MVLMLVRLKKYFFVNTVTGEKSGEMLVSVKLQEEAQSSKKYKNLLLQFKKLIQS